MNRWRTRTSDNVEGRAGRSLVGKNIGVTGGRGALGSRLVEMLLDAGANVIAFDLRAQTVPHGSAINRQAADRTGDILDTSTVREAIQGCSTVFHLAGLVNADESRRMPLRYFEANAQGTVSVLEACRAGGVTRIIYTSTSHVYGRPHYQPVNEEHPTHPESIYAASKLAGEVAVGAYAETFGLAADIVRIANLYGPTSGTETVVGRALEQAARAESISLRDLSSVRDFIYADDVARALVSLAASDQRSGTPGVFNVSTGRGVSVRDVAEAVATIAADEGLPGISIVDKGAAVADRIPRLVLDNRRLVELTDWRPEVSLEAGLRLAFNAVRARTVR